MAGPIALSLMAAQLTTAQLAPPASAATNRAVSVQARATVRILPGAKVSLSAQAEGQGYKLNSATITAEDGRRLSIKLVEFQ